MKDLANISLVGGIDTVQAKIYSEYEVLPDIAGVNKSKTAGKIDPYITGDGGIVTYVHTRVLDAHEFLYGKKYQVIPTFMEYVTALTKMFNQLGAVKYRIQRVDCCVDSYDEETVEQLKRLNLSLCCLLKELRGYVEPVWSGKRYLFERGSTYVNGKGKGETVTYYDKAAESKGKSPAKYRLELRHYNLEYDFNFENTWRILAELEFWRDALNPPHNQLTSKYRNMCDYWNKKHVEEWNSRSGKQSKAEFLCEVKDYIFDARQNKELCAELGLDKQVASTYAFRYGFDFVDPDLIEQYMKMIAKALTEFDDGKRFIKPL
jgi:hypothetical protein